MTTRLATTPTRRHAALIALLLAVSGLVAVGAATPAEAAAPALRANRAAVIKGEAVSITGKLSTRLKRPVVLQVQVGRAWRAVAKTSSTKTGAFAFSVRSPKTSAYRAYAPKKKIAGKKRAAITSRALRVSVVAQSAVAYTLPGIAAYGSTPAASTAAQVVIASRFSPVRPGRTVVLQQRTDSGWTNVATSRQNTIGSAAFRLSSIPAGTLRAVALASGGAPAWAAVVGERRWTPDTDTDTEFTSGSFGASLPEGWGHRQEEEYPGGKRNCARTTSEMTKIRNGVAEISAMRDATRVRRTETQCPLGTYQNGHIGTSYKVGYGIAAARVKFQRGDGQHGAFWLQSQSGNLGAEIDVAEFFGDGRADGGLNQYVHYRDSSGRDYNTGTFGDKTHPARAQQALASADDDFWKNYHVYSVEWTPSMYIFRIDGVETFRTTKGLTNRQAILVLSLQTSDYELPNNDGSKQTMYVDWVRTWTPG